MLPLVVTSAAVIAADPPTRWIEIPGNGWSAREAGRELDISGRPSSEAEHRYGDWSRGWAQYMGSGDSVLGDQHDIFGGLASRFYMPDLNENCFAFNLGLLESTQPGDFMPPAGSLSETTLALVPNRIAGASTSWNGLSRPTIDQRVDLITGVPLVQFEDLSLPFGGSQFRLIRSRSADRSLSYRPPEGANIHASPYRTRWWDWMGSGWMMSENPILLIDSTLPDEVSRGGTPRCKFWPDAFHSISFDWIDGESDDEDADGEKEQRGYYECSPRFRAKLTASRDGTAGRKHSNELGGPVRRTAPSETEVPNAGQWKRFPDKFEVSLYEGEIVYEFTPVWQDVPKWNYKFVWEGTTRASDIWTSLHERPMHPVGMKPEEGGAGSGMWPAKLASKSPWQSSPIESGNEPWNIPSVGPTMNGRGLGMPYYALVTAIRDKFGNRAEIKYTPLLQHGNPAALQLRPSEGDQNLEPRVASTILQNINQKGQVREIRLKTADGVTRWTLLYTYRLIPTARNFAAGGFSAWDQMTDEEKRCWSDSVLDTIYVYEGAANTRDVTLVRSHAAASIVAPLEEARAYLNHDGDMIEKYILNELPDTIYSPDPNVPYPTATERHSLEAWKYRCRYYYTVANDNATCGRPSTSFVASPAQLMRTQVEGRSSSISGNAGAIDAPGRNKFFLYSGGTPQRFTPWLAAVLDDAGIDRMAGALEKDPATSAWMDASTHATAMRSLELLRGRDLEFVPSSGASDETISAAREAGVVYLRNATEEGLAGVPGGNFGQISVDQLLSDTGTALLPATNGWCTDSSRGTVGAVSFTDANGDRKYYRITRFAAIPGSTSGEQIVTAWPLGLETQPMRSVFHVPYYWQAYGMGNLYKFPEFSLSWDNGQGSTGNVPATSTKYEDARWIVVLDEFPTMESLRDSRHITIEGGSTTHHSFFANQSSRQIFGINPQGNVLWKKNYLFNGNRFTESGDKGLTEEWVYESGEQILAGLGKSPSVIGEAPKAFKIERFLVGKKSVGYAAAPVTIPASAIEPARKSKGLIHTFAYGDVVPTQPLAGTPQSTGYSWGERIKLIGTGVRNGDIEEGNNSGATTYFRTQTFYDPADPTLVTASVQFTTPVTTLASTVPESGAIVSRFVTEKEKDSETDFYTKIQNKSVSPAHQLDPNDPNSKYYDVSFDIAGSGGLVVWSVSATLPNADSLAFDSGDENVRVQLTYFKHNWRGQPLEIWADVDRDVQSSSGLTISAEDLALLPSGLNRVGGSTAARELCTTYKYDEEDGTLSETHFPNKRVYARRKFKVPDNEEPQINGGKSLTRIYHLSELESRGGSLYKTGSLCTIEDYGEFEATNAEVVMFNSGNGVMGLPFGDIHKTKKSVLLRTRQVVFNGTINLNDSEYYTDFEVKPPTKLGYDSAGRITSVESLDLDWTGNASSAANVTNNGDRIRTKEMDGNTTLRIRNAMGQLVRTYSGSRDATWDDNVWVAPSRMGSDMQLRERTEFGKDWTNALLPHKAWRYLETPAQGWEPANLKPFGAAPEDDPEGELTQTSYDWRMRPVRVDTFGPEQGDPASRLRHSTRLTYLDHADRPIMEASFGSEGQTAGYFDSIDPSLFVPSSGNTNPSATPAAVLAKKPLSLVTTSYFPDGAVQERRTYRVRSEEAGGYQGSDEYTVERFGYGAGGREVFSQRTGSGAAGSPIQITVLDNLGRTLSEKSVLPRTVEGAADNSYELTRTDYGYDADSNVILTARWERILPGGGSGAATPGGAAVLSRANAVCVLTENWYDASKRLLVTAEYGSGDSRADGSGTFFTPESAPTLASRLLVRVPLGADPPASPELFVPGIEGASEWEVNRGGVDARVPLTVHCYDRAGNKVGSATQKNFAASESGLQYVFTRMEYDAKGRLFVLTDDAQGIARRTKYGYWLGRTVSIGSATGDESTTWQTQGAVYGAEIVAETADASSGDPKLKWISRSNALVGAMLSTNPGKEINTGSMEPIGSGGLKVPSASGFYPDVIAGLDQFQYDRPDFAYRYYADGQIAERVDRRRIAMRYFYDDQRRLKEVEVWHYPDGELAVEEYPETEVDENTTVIRVAQNIYKLSTAQRGYPPFLKPFFDADPLTPEVPAPTNRVGFISYAYDSRGNTARVTARESRANTDIISDTKFEYDERGNLVREYQAHGCAWDEDGVAVIRYGRVYEPAAGNASGGERLVSMTYPAFVPSWTAAPEPGAAALSGSRINFGYGASGSIDAASGRITSIGMGTTRIAGFTYTGAGRRVSIDMGGTASAPALWSNFGGASPAANSLPGLDAFGRVRDLHYVRAGVSGGGGFTLYRGEHEYDAAGNRLHEKLTQSASDERVWGSGASAWTQLEQSGSNARSRQFGYDKLDRLIASHSGALSSSFVAGPGSESYPTVRSERWELDKLGNWKGNVSTESPQGDPCVLEDTTIPTGFSGPGVHTTPPCVNCVMDPGVLPGHSVVFDEEGEERQMVLWEAHGTEQGVAHNADATEVLFGHQPNAVKTVLNLPVGAAGAGAWNPPNAGRSWRKQYTDPSGNLTFDGEYFYQYDAWNRLVQVNRSGNLTAWRFDRWGMPQHLEAGFIRPSSCGIPAELGALVKHQTYDGVGRLIRTSSPIQAPEGWEFEAGEGGPSSAPDPWFTRSERFFYDGVRRIQEVVTDPILADGEGNRVATMSFENDNRNGHGNGGGGSGGSGGVSVLPTVSVFLRAQYVWGPGDNGVDELLCQIEPDNSLDAPDGDGGTNGHGPRGKPWYVLTDAQGDVTSIVEVGQDLNGNPVTSVAGQWTYSPYGEILTYDQLSDHPAVVFGHKTLVMDRLDGPTLTWQDESEPGAEDWTFFETRRLEPEARLIAYARNRTLDVQRGRWLQVDPNQSGARLIVGLSFHGQPPLIDECGASLDGRRGDGQNLCEYVGTNPIANSDPRGLFMGGLIGLLGGSTSTMDMYADSVTNSLENGSIAFRKLNQLMGDYAADAEADMDWALDWSQGDSWQSRAGTAGEIESLLAFSGSGSNSSGAAELMMAGVMSPLMKSGKAAGEALLRGWRVGVNKTYLPTAVNGKAGKRMLDGVLQVGSKTFGFEVKCTAQGVVRMSSTMKNQIAKDAYLISNKMVDGVVWVFKHVNGSKPNLDPKLIQELRKANIPYVFAK